MKDIIIVGAGGLGREVLLNIKRINAVKPTWNIKGFINDIPDTLDNLNYEYKIIGTIKDYIPKENDVFALGISSPKGKEKVVNILKPKGAVFEKVISPYAVLGDNIEFGEGCYISGQIVGSDVKLGAFTSIMGSMIGLGSIIGDYSTTTGFANIAGAKLGKGVFVGSHAVVINDRVIGDDAFICVGSIVISNVKAGTKVFGNPAKKSLL